MRKLVFSIACLLQAAWLPGAESHGDGKDWPAYHGGPAGLHYSPLSQINRQNVRSLAVAWSFDTGDAFPGSEMECNPIVVGGVLYAVSPKLRVFALDAATGKPLWNFDPNEGRKITIKARSRGVSYWQSGETRRIFFVSGHSLFGLDAATGKPVPAFGAKGHLDLREDLGRKPTELSVTATSPPAIYQDLLIVSTLVSEDLPSAPGDIRAYDTRTGKLRWSFHTIPHPGEFGYKTWPADAWKYSGGANNWAGMAVDEKRGLVFAPTGSAAFDFYGANRTGDDLFANCLLALNASTGERVWHFQGVHHDVWDRDFPAPPTLVTVKRDGRDVDAVAQITKSGFVFLFDRQTGQPLFPIEERAVPPSEVDGEVLAKTQPFPVKPPPFARQILDDDTLTDRTPEAHKAALERLHKLHSTGQFTPPSFAGSIVFPGFDGGGEWGGGAFDPATGLFYVNANEMAWVLRLVPRATTKGAASGRSLYESQCASCHRPDRRGTPPEFPSLVAIGDKYNDSEIRSIIRQGGGRMPAFATLPRESLQAITQYLLTGKDTAVAGVPVPVAPLMKYTTDGYNKFLDPDGYPAVAPPWGTLNAINLNTGEIAWKIPFGEYPELAAQGLRNTGCENYGGPLVTAGGLVLIGATNLDRKFHAYDKLTGELLWETTLPAAGNATPATYEVNGRQFVVIAAGGGKSGTRSDGVYVAFALPAQN
jgi:quinoprotein glucose dehydrogenase